MRLTVQRAALLEALAHVRGCVPHARSCADRPILGCFHIDAREGELVVTGTDALNVGARFTVPANVDRSGAIAAPVAEFFPVVSALRDGEVRIERERLVEPITLKSGRSRYQLEVLDADLFPKVEELTREGKGEVPAWLLAQMIPLVESSMDDGGRPNLAGAHLEVTRGALSFVSTDGNRLTAATHAVEFHADAVTIPPAGVRELRKLAERAAKADANAVVSLDVSSRKLVARHGQTAMVTALVTEPFAPWRQGIPSKSAHVVRLRVADLVTSLRALRTVESRDKIPRAVFSFGGGTLRLTSERIGAKGTEELPVDLDATARFGCNTTYALDALASIAAVSDEVRIEFSEELDPIVFRPAEDGPLGLVAVVMPMRLS